MIGVLLLGGAWAVQWAPAWVAVCYMVVAVLVWLWALLRERAANCDDSARYRIMNVIVTVVAGVSMVALLIMQAIGHGAWQPPHSAPTVFLFVVLYGGFALRRVR
ncbi:MAG: hypothetical protein ACR2PC_09480 [Tsuneonella suprasediminis]|uniref:DUF2178 domain-containing protein n=1 Tax=Tsuneonella suprasediminis TaxID=2306996 RepID=A0A419R0H3_9SPHN|nr:hypothetical protein [Tsuneonella suprasediminis]RJX66797.1 hypothetical protein D6858_10495 [Tsuneonella suprasediminis]UBS32412.1 hypothetical protein LBX01_13125 [Altererythrobacter sp. N1]